MKGRDARRTCGSGSVGAVRSKVRLAASHKHLKGKPWCKVLAVAGPPNAGGSHFPPGEVFFGCATILFLQACRLELCVDESCRGQSAPPHPKRI